MKVGIYKWTNIVNNKVYIGKSSNIIRRKTEHLYTLRNNKHRNHYLQNSFNKYGEDCFKFEIVELCDEDDLNEREEYYIKLYKTLDKKYGYNLMENDGRNNRHSQETKKKMSASHSGKKKSILTRMNMSKAFKGRVYSIEHNRKLSESLKGKRVGENNNQAIISDSKAKEILLFMLNNETSMKNIAKSFDVSYDVVVNLKNNKSYKHILESKRNLIKDKYNSFNKYNKDNNDSRYYEIIELFKNGYSQSKISKELKCSRNTIRKILTENNMLIPR